MYYLLLEVRKMRKCEVTGATGAASLHQVNYDIRILFVILDAFHCFNFQIVADVERAISRDFILI